MDLIKALCSIAEDKHWIKKILIGGLLILLAIIAECICIILFESKTAFIWSLLPFIISVLLIMYPMGFIFATLHKQINENSNVMIEWNEKNLLLSGFKSCVTFFIMGLCWSSIAVILMGGFSISYSLAGNSAVLNILFIIFVLIYLLYLLLLFITIPISVLCYGKTLKVLSSVNFKKIFAIFKENQPKMWMLILWTIAYVIIYSIIQTILLITIIGIIAIPFLYFYFYIVYMNLLAQFAREIDINKYL